MLLRTRVHYLLCYANSGQLVVEFWASKVFKCTVSKTTQLLEHCCENHNISTTGQFQLLFLFKTTIHSCVYIL